jgi:hypothetical protein
LSNPRPSGTLVALDADGSELWSSEIRLWAQKPRIGSRDEVFPSSSLDLLGLRATIWDPDCSPPDTCFVNIVGRE